MLPQPKWYSSAHHRMAPKLVAVVLVADYLDRFGCDTWGCFGPPEFFIGHQYTALELQYVSNGEFPASELEWCVKRLLLIQ